jgi:hypothetical protein
VRLRLEGRPEVGRVGDLHASATAHARASGASWKGTVAAAGREAMAMAMAMAMATATAAPPGPAVRARRPRASGGHPTSPTCRPSARSRGPAGYREYSSVGVCLFHGAYGCKAYSTQQTPIAAGTVHRATVDEHAAHSMRRRAKHASTSVFHCAITDSDLKTARHAEQTQTHTNARLVSTRRNGSRVSERPPTAGVAAMLHRTRIARPVLDGLR